MTETFETVEDSETAETSETAEKRDNGELLFLQARSSEGHSSVNKKQHS